MKKFNFKTILAFSICMLSLVAACGASFAWFASVSVTNENIITGSSEGAYFAYGTGTEEDPYGISNTRHLNNLAWLQYSGQFNKGEHVHFELANDINTNGVTYTTLPIGTEENPFIGVFNGNGHTIHNIKITNDSNGFSDKPRSISYNQTDAEVVGFFGVVGKLANESYSSSVNSISNLTLDNLTVESKTSKTLIGLAAGYVNASMSGIKIDGDATIDVNGQSSTAKTNLAGVTKLSDFGLVGYSTKLGNSGNSYFQHLSEYYNNGAGGSGGGNNFGDSIDMLNLYGRLSKVFNEDAYDNGNYSVDTINYPDGSSEKQKKEVLSSGKPVNNYSGIYGNDYSYTFNKNSAGNQDFYYLYGDYSPVSGTKTDNIYNASEKEGSATKWNISQSDGYYTFSSSGQYLKIPTVGGSSSVTITTSHKTSTASEATRFTRIKNGSNYQFYTTETYNGSTSYIFLAHTSTTTLNVRKYASPNQSYSVTYWSINGSNIYYSSNNCYLIYGSNKFGFNASGTHATMNESSNTFYLTASSDGTLNKTASSGSATPFYFVNSKLFFIEGGKTYYLNYNGSQLIPTFKISETNATTWSYSNNKLSFVYSGTTYYLDISNQNHASTSSKESTMTNIGTGSLSGALYISSSSTQQSAIPVNSFKNAYLPISTNKNIYSTANKNSGYIISGKSYDESAVAGYNGGDIRVSRYDMSNISESMGQSTFDNKKMYVITATSNNDFALVTDSYNSGSSVPSGLTGITGRKSASELARYNAWTDSNGIDHDGARYSMGETFTEDSDNIYGLHFMETNIDRTDLVNHRDENIQVVPNAKINGTTYSDGLEMVKDSIDFFVKENGYITFFAGTYFSNNKAFFSLSKVTRNADNTIKSIDEIHTIYKDSSNNYYYNPTSTTGLTKVFDTAVLTGPTESKYISNAVYYFEIPVGIGEFALGSTSKNGAYLMYLDISASGESVEKDCIAAHYITTVETGCSYPTGVDFAPLSVTGNGGETFGIYIDSGNQGTITFKVQSASSKISVNGTANLSTYSFQGSKYSSSAGSGVFTVDGDAPPKALEDPSEGGTRVLLIDVMTVEPEATYQARITDTLDSNGSIVANNSTFEIDYMDGNGFESVNLDDIIDLSGELTESIITDFRSLTVAATLARENGTTNVFTTTYDTENCNYDDCIVAVDVERNGTTISVSVTSGYHLYINGDEYTNGSTYPSN